MFMTEENERNCGIDPHNPQHLLILAYARLFLAPERTDGRKVSTIASQGSLELRLVEYTVRGPVPPLWIELVDPREGRVIESVGCYDLEEAGAVTERLFHGEVGAT
jgi:hypothetical protein